MPSQDANHTNEKQDGRPRAAVPVAEDGSRAAAKPSASASPRPSVRESSAGKNQAALKKRAYLSVMKEKERRQRIARGLGLFIIGAAIFCLGFFLRGWQPFMDRIDPSLAATTALQQATTTASTDTVSSRVAEVEQILSTESMDEYDTDKVTDVLLQSFSDAVGDKYLRYFDEERYALYVKENASDGYSGIGVLFAEYEGKTYAADVFANSVADLAGVRQGDYVQAINGDSSHQWTPTEVINTINADAGSEIVITWRRASTLESESDTVFSTSLQCQEYQETNVSASLEEDGRIGLIGIKQLSQNSSSLVSSAVTSLIGQGARAFVLDLRGCSGGYLSQAVDIASLFVKSGSLVQIETKDGITNKTASGSVITELPLVVLVDGETAGTAEVLAAALSDSDRADLVGATTLGKGSVQVVQKLSFGGALRYTAAYYLTPLGHAIDGAGVTPDTLVSDADDQQSVALQLALSYVSD